VILVQGLIVGRVFTPRPHSGGDNAGYVTLAHSLLERGAYLELWDPDEPPHTKYPPVFPLFLAAAVLLGAKGWAALKLVPAMATVLAVGFALLWARERRGLAMGLGVALLLGLSESVVYYSQWVLSDPAFLALTLGALWALEKADRDREGEGAKVGFDPWMGVGIVLVTLAYLTRSAGLPLAVATVGWLLLERRWKGLAVVVVVFGIPAFLWWLRGAVVGGGDYVSEFWLVDPYQPYLGTVGLGGLVERAAANLGRYPTSIIPGGIVGDGWPFLPPLGIGLGLLALVGWIRCVRDRIRVAELFLPLYLGLILLWPLAWSGDRFSLPLLPLLFFYSGEALSWTLGSVPKWSRVVVPGAAILVLAVPAGLTWNNMARPALECREATRTGHPLECLPSAEAEYRSLAEWSRRNLPDGAVVTTRKPRIFYLMSGVKAQSIPLVQDQDEFLALLEEKGSRYVSLDRLDGVSGYYVYPVVVAK